ncbi:MAG: hypothetical protein HYV07_05005 [Deltaproteobacteria bacterium]|nr:hypothetical protein [Deltaproteobacteria bacterium]
MPSIAQDTSLADLVGAFAADLVIVVKRGKKIVAVVVVEIQLSWDDEKLYSWPLYLVATAARYRCPAYVLVVSPDPRVRRRAKRGESWGTGFSFAPMVLDPKDVPRVTSAEEAMRSPERAVLSAVVHAKEAGAETLAARALAGIHESRTLDEDRQAAGFVC